MISHLERSRQALRRTQDCIQRCMVRGFSFSCFLSLSDDGSFFNLAQCITAYSLRQAPFVADGLWIGKIHTSAGSTPCSSHHRTPWDLSYPACAKSKGPRVMGLPSSFSPHPVRVHWTEASVWRFLMVRDLARIHGTRSPSCSPKEIEPITSSGRRWQPTKPSVVVSRNALNKSVGDTHSRPVGSDGPGFNEGWLNFNVGDILYTDGRVRESEEYLLRVPHPKYAIFLWMRTPKIRVEKRKAYLAKNVKGEIGRACRLVLMCQPFATDNLPPRSCASNIVVPV